MTIETDTHGLGNAVQQAATRNSALWARLTEFQAPYLTDKLVRSGLADDDTAADALFLEIKKYLYLATIDDTRMPMISSIVDAAWHQFILFTTEYNEFCRAVWGEYQHHAPRTESAGAPDGVTAQTLVESYHRTFGPLPEVWHNERILRPDTRLVRPNARDSLLAREDEGKATLVRARSGQEVLCRTSLRALPALEFIARHKTFFVRELPGLTSDAERIALLSPLVQFDILNLAA